MQQRIGFQELAADVLIDAGSRVEPLPIGWYAAQHGVDRNPLIRAVAGEELMGVGKRHRQQLEQGGRSPVEGCLVGEHVTLHHADVRAGDRQEQVAFFERVIPGILQQPGNPRFYRQQVGELIDDHG